MTPHFTHFASASAWQALTPSDQWQHLLAQHAGQWNGLLIRFDGTGQVLDVLDSVRQFTPSSDRQTITHSLDFRSRHTRSVRQQQWNLTPGDPLISHPVDPNALLLFNPTGADAMVGRDRTKPEGFYFEPYLRIGNRRVSVVVMYRGAEAGAEPNFFSLFREVRADSGEPWWSSDTTCRIQPCTQLSLSLAQPKAMHIQLETLHYRHIAPDPQTIAGDFLQIQFPDGIELVLSCDRFHLPYCASLNWAAQQATRRCLLLYSQPSQQPELLAF